MRLRCCIRCRHIWKGTVVFDIIKSTSPPLPLPNPTNCIRISACTMCLVLLLARESVRPRVRDSKRRRR